MKSLRHACLASSAALALVACRPPHIVSYVGPTLDYASVSDFAQADFRDAAFVPGNNVVTFIVDGGPAGNDSDVGYISVTLCAPGTSNCQTVDHISIDTGSVGLRIIGSVLDQNLLGALPNSMLSGEAIAECYAYADGYVYGSVRSADFTIGGELSSAMPFQVIGDLGAAPADCAALGSPEETVSAFGGNGIIGVALFSPDCGTACTAGNAGNPLYYACTGGTCTDASVPENIQVPNPVATFSNDNNGVIIELPTVDDTAGATNPTGMLTFGIGTQQNNTIGGAKIYAAADSSGLESVTGNVNGTSFPVTIFDSGTSTLALTLSGIPACDQTQAPGFLCPTSTQALTATITDANNASGMVSFSIANAVTLFQSDQSSTAFDDIGGVGVSDFLIFGLPFFYGRKMFFAIDGASTPSGAGPYYAF